MLPYFAQMPALGKPLSESRAQRAQVNRQELSATEAALSDAARTIQDQGLSADEINARGLLTVWQRIERLVDPGSWRPLHTLFNPAHNDEGTTNVVDGLGRIAGRWAVVIGFNNKVLAGAWLAGQAENVLRVTDLARRLNIPLVWLVNCSGLKLTEQEKFFAGRRGGGTTFFRHAELEQAGIPILAGIYGTNPAGGGYHSISPTILLAQKDANMAVGGVGIVSGMSPKG
ncbi:MAG: carboxyl transferase domain-containing protein, partial [Vicinamibacterales bacterium]